MVAWDLLPAGFDHPRRQWNICFLHLLKKKVNLQAYTLMSPGGDLPCVSLRCVSVPALQAFNTCLPFCVYFSGVVGGRFWVEHDLPSLPHHVNYRAVPFSMACLLSQTVVTCHHVWWRNGTYIWRRPAPTLTSLGKIQ